MWDIVNYVNFFHTNLHRATGCCPRWAEAW